MTSYIGQLPATSFDSGIQDRFTGLTTRTVTLNHDISAEEDILIVWNNVVQDKNTYSVGGTGNKTVTLGGTLVSADVVTVYYLNKVMQSVNPTTGSVNTTQLADLGISTAKLQATSVTGAKLNTDAISAQTALAVAPADTDEFMVSDGGVLKRIDYSLIKGGANTPYSIHYDTDGFASAQSISASTQTEITAWDSGSIVNAGGASYSSGRITLGTAGKYMVTCAVGLESIETNKEIRLRIGVSGTTLDCFRLRTGNSGGANTALTGSVGVTLTDANYVSFFIYHSDSASRNLSSGNFSIVKIIE